MKGKIVTEQEARELADKVISRFLYQLCSKHLFVQIGALGYFQISSLQMVGLKELFDSAIRAGIYEIAGANIRKQRKDRCAVQ